MIAKNFFLWIERNTLAPHLVELPSNANPKLVIESGPAYAGLAVVDTNPQPYGVQTSIRVPLSMLVCAYLQNIYDTSRLSGEAEKIHLAFVVPPCRGSGITVEGRIAGSPLPPLPSPDDVDVWNVQETPAADTFDGVPYLVWSRANPTPPLGGMRAIARADEVQVETAPERLKGGLLIGGLFGIGS